jgi:alpha-1,6-mannosyltransferase
VSVIDGPLGAAANGTAVDLTSPAATKTSEVASSSRLGQLGLASVFFTGLLLCLAASKTNALLPIRALAVAEPSLAGAFAHIGFYLPAGGVLGALTLMFIGYVLVVRHADRLSARAVLATIGAFVLVVVLAPPLFSTDLFSYQEYSRMFFGLHVNPYTNTSQVLGGLNGDPLYSYIGAKWINTPTVYGPLFTLISGLFEKTSSPAAIAFSAFAYKAIAGVSCLGIVYMMWKAAKLRGLNPVRGAALFGLNPLVILYGVGGGHNDLLMMALATAAIWAMLARRERSGGALTVAAAAIKLTGGIFLPFALVGNPGLGASARRRKVLFGAAVAAVIAVGVGIAVFGSGITNMFHTLSTVQGEGGWQSVPGFFFTALDWKSASHLISMLFGLAFATICCRLLWRVYRNELDWLDGAAWATFWLLIATSSILPWYVSWLLVPVALCTNRKLWTAAIWFSGWVLLSTMVAYLPHSPVILGFQT